MVKCTNLNVLLRKMHKNISIPLSRRIKSKAMLKSKMLIIPVLIISAGMTQAKDIGTTESANVRGTVELRDSTNVQNQLKMKKLKTTRIENKVISAYQSIENGVVNCYKNIENGVVSCYKNIENRFVDKFLEDVPNKDEQQ